METLSQSFKDMMVDGYVQLAEAIMEDKLSSDEILQLYEQYRFSIADMIKAKTKNYMGDVNV